MLLLGLDIVEHSYKGSCINPNAEGPSTFGDSFNIFGQLSLRVLMGKRMNKVFSSNSIIPAACSIQKKKSGGLSNNNESPSVDGCKGWLFSSFRGKA